MLDYNEIKKGKVIIYEDEPYEVLDSHVARTQQRKPQNQVKMRSLVSGRAVTTVFHSSDRAEEADMVKRPIKYLYSNKGEHWFSDINNPANRFMLPDNLVADSLKWMKQNSEVEALIFDFDDEERTIGIRLPVKIDFVVKEAAPAVKGNTATGATKRVTLENGTEIEVPLFISEGEKVRINTETGEYVERVS